MRVKCPAELESGDVIWLWHPRGPAKVARVDPCPNETAMVRLADGRVIEIYTKQLVS